MTYVIIKRVFGNTSFVRCEVVRKFLFMRLCIWNVRNGNIEYMTAKWIPVWRIVELREKLGRDDTK